MAYQTESVRNPHQLGVWRLQVAQTGVVTGNCQLVLYYYGRTTNRTIKTYIHETTFPLITRFKKDKYAVDTARSGIIFS